MGIKTIVNKIARPVLRPLRFKTAKLTLDYLRLYKENGVIKNTILYEVRDGQSITDSPRAIFEYLLKNDPEQKYTHVWVTVPSAELNIIIAEYAKYKNVQFVVRNTYDYLDWLTKAEYLINNATFQPFVTIKAEQKYINTWHGTPLKYMGFDIPGKHSNAQNVLRNFAQADYLLMPNQYTSDIFINSYRLKGLMNGEILESGYPRIDYTFATDHHELFARLGRLNFKWAQDKKIILYAPTWKGNQISAARNDVAQIIEEFSILRQQFNGEYNVLIKVHPFLYKTAAENQALAKYLIPDVIDTNELLAATDILITDYSSIYFDFLVTGRPIIFYSWDEDLYLQDRGCYIDPKDLPGPSCYRIEKVAEAITHIDQVQADFAANYAKAQELFVNYDDGLATKRYVDYMFNNQKETELKVYAQDLTKERILFYPGGMINNGITSSFINLVSNLDFDKYEVTCILGASGSQTQIKNINLLPAEVSLLFNFSDPLYSIWEHYKGTWIHGKGLTKGNQKFFPEKAYQLEMQRLVGRAEYDFAIDFSGYSLFWSKFILATNAKKKLVYLHSDMIADSQRTVRGKKIHKLNLEGLFTVYNRYDRLISVTEIINEINKENLAAYATPDKFVPLPNTIDSRSILATEEAPVLKLTNQPIIHRFNREAKMLPEIEKITIKSEANPEKDSHDYQILAADFPAQVSVIGQVIYGEQEFYKVMSNNKYLGWVDAEDLQLLPVKLIEETRVYKYGRINTGAAAILYSGPVGLEDTVALDRAASLKNINVKIIKEAVTDSDTSFLLSLKGKKIGWLTTANLREYQFDNSFKYKFLNEVLLRINQFTNRKKIKRIINNRVLAKELLPGKVIQVTQPVQLFQTLIGVHPVEVPENDMLPVGEILKVLSLAKTPQGTYYEVDTGKRMGYVDASFATTIEKTPAAVFYAEELAASVEFKQDKLVAENTIKAKTDPAQRDFSQFKIQLEQMYQAVRKVKTLAGEVYLEVEGISPGESLWVLEEQVEIKHASAVLNNRQEFIDFPAGDEMTFVTLGRLSPEKDQASLINAFNKFYQQKGEGYLYIIGDGPLYDDLLAQIAELKLEKRVTLVGHIDRPFAFMQKCDLFILTSLYEGQSLAIIEALTLGLPVISTDIPACRQVLANGRYGLLTATNDVTGIYESMLDYYENKPRFEKFDYVSYNYQAKDSFTNILNATK